tara:strand:+ start:505 stop:759 length:255 start_codon:yes stop_codon:yes gene_type:complete
MLVVRCKECNKEITGHETQAKSCGCPNMTTVQGESVTAVDLSKVIMLQSDNKQSKKQSLFSPQELQFQEERRKRKVRKLDFEIR